MTQPSRSAACGVAITLLLLAGCLGAPSGLGPASSPGASTGNDLASGVANTTTSAAAGQNLANVPHMHDYWNGRSRVTLFDADLAPDAANSSFATGFDLLVGHAIEAGYLEWTLPAGRTVYEGTGIMEFTATWTDARTTGIAFDYRSAAGPDYKAGGALPNAIPFDLPVTAAMTDMPHSSSTRWDFVFTPDKSPGAMLGPFHLKVEIVRLRDIALWPAHPDPWAGAHTVTLLDADHSASQVSYVQRGPQVVENGNFSEDEVALARPVPMEAREVSFTITVKSATSTPGKVTAIGFFYHGADRPDMLRCSVKPLNGSLPTTLTWTVPNPMNSSDSPYANDSQWRFLAEPQVSLTGADPPAGGLTDTHLEYHVTAVAYDSLATKAETCRVNG
ncbi:MAG: hypothetical protein ACYDDF_08480 [Thermoplasmatota archaeon]